MVKTENGIINSKKYGKAVTIVIKQKNSMVKPEKVWQSRNKYDEAEKKQFNREQKSNMTKL